MRILFAILLGISLCDAQVVLSRRVAAAAAEIALDDTSKGEQTSGATYTQAHTCTGAGILVVGVASYLEGAGQTMTAEYNGDAMSTLGVSTSGENELEYFYILTPDAGTHNIVVTPSSSSAEVACAAMSLTNVTAITGGIAGGATGTAWTVTVTSETGSWATALLATYNLVPTVTNGTIRVANSNGTAQLSVYLLTRDGAASVQINGTIASEWSWMMFGASADQ